MSNPLRWWTMRIQKIGSVLRNQTADEKEDLFIKPGSLVDLCSYERHSPKDQVIQVLIDGGRQVFFVTSEYELQTEWHFNEYLPFSWVFEDSRDEPSKEFVFVYTPDDPLAAGFIVRESLIM